MRNRNEVTVDANSDILVVGTENKSCDKGIQTEDVCDCVCNYNVNKVSVEV